MTLLIFIISIWNYLGVNDPEILFKISPSFSDRQLIKIEKKLLKNNNISAKIQVLKRDRNGQIIHLKYQVINKSSCESDNFAELHIRNDGCWISDKLDTNKGNAQN